MVNNHHDTDILISKFLSGEASPDEAILLEDWKAESEENLHYFLEAEKLFNLTENEAPQEINVSAAWQKVAPQLTVQEAITTKARKAKIIRLSPAFFRMAASVLLLIGIGAFAGYNLFNSPKGEKVFVAAANQKDLKLADGSEIVMASNSSISVDADFGKSNRRVKLAGSAYFTVKHDAKMPFIIDAGNVFIKDLGTKFEVVSANDTLSVSVDEGSVSMYDNLGQQTTLRAGESAYYLQKDKKLVVKQPEIQMIKLDFANKKLSEVAKSLSKAYGTNVELQSSTLANLTITTKFENEDIDVVLAIITETLGLKYEKTGKGYLILAAK